MVKKGGLFIFLSIVLIGISFITFTSPDEVETLLEVPVSSPLVFEVPIPNQIWATNTNHTNALNLNNHFTNYMGTNTTFNVTEVENITILIDEEGFVSFYPDLNFEGIREVVFHAQAAGIVGLYNASSNFVQLEVLLDEESPKWSNPQKSRTDIFQSDFIRFYTNWTDNLALDSFLFSINQGSGWVNGSRVYFSGVSNFSKQTIQISAPGGTGVSWAFYAWDTSGNINRTSIQTFTVEITETPTEPGPGEEVIIDPEEIISEFSVTPGIIELKMKQGEEITRFLRIQNEGRESSNFKIVLNGLEEFLVLDKTEVTIPGRTSQTITLDFKVGERTFPDLYFGYIDIIGDSKTRRVPIILEINPLEIDFEVGVQVKNKDKRVLPGKEVEIEIRITNLGDYARENGTFYYAIKDVYGKTLDFSQEEFELKDEEFFIRTLKIPTDTLKGYYIVYVRGNLEKETSIATDNFEVGARFDVAGFIKLNFILILIILISLITALLIIRSRRNRERLKILNLYLKVNELKELINQKQLDKAIEYYIKIKSEYGEPVSEKILDNKEKLKEEMQRLADSFDKKNSGLKEISKEVEDNDKEKKEGEEIEEKNLEKKGSIKREIVKEKMNKEENIKDEHLMNKKENGEELKEEKENKIEEEVVKKRDGLNENKKSQNKIKNQKLKKSLNKPKKRGNETKKNSLKTDKPKTKKK
ncbi:hypothetical protein K0A97_02615 [Patescibacteria group bacterium]|nr:hypothetical protein [Patescibacteria group bacterium]